jgi:protein transport protein SEC31
LHAAQHTLPSHHLLLQYGLIAGGLADGSVCVWNPARIIGHKAEQPTSPAAASSGQLLARLQKHQGPVKGLEFNNFR